MDLKNGHTVSREPHADRTENWKEALRRDLLWRARSRLFGYIANQQVWIGSIVQMHAKAYCNAHQIKTVQ